MFTGIIEEIGTVVDLLSVGSSVRIEIRAQRVFQGVDLYSTANPVVSHRAAANPAEERGKLDGLKIDDSIAVNGVCLTVVNVTPPSFEVVAVKETLEKTTLGSLKVEWDRAKRSGATPNIPVNLERAVTPTTRLGGHLVQGHVDATARVAKITDLDGSWQVQFELPDHLLRYVVQKGSVTMNGVSLTVAAIRPQAIVEVAIIPHTYDHTNFQFLKVDDPVNVEVDVIAKMLERLTQPYRDA